MVVDGPYVVNVSSVEDREISNLSPGLTYEFKVKKVSIIICCAY